MNRLFVVQKQHRWNKATNEFEPKFDLSAAEKFGELVFLLSPTAAPFRPDHIIEELKEKLNDYTPEDSLLLVGNPILIGFTVAIAADATDGDVSLLQWSGKDNQYINVKASGLLTNWA